MVPGRPPKGHQKVIKNDDFSDPPKRYPKVTKMTPKSDQNGPKMVPKWSQNGPKKELSGHLIRSIRLFVCLVCLCVFSLLVRSFLPVMVCSFACLLSVVVVVAVVAVVVALAVVVVVLVVVVVVVVVVVAVVVVVVAVVVFMLLSHRFSTSNSGRACKAA